MKNWIMRWILPKGLFMSRDLHKMLESIKPGVVEYISCTSTGSQFAILSRDDFEYILDLADLRVESRTMPTSAQQQSPEPK